MRTLQILMCWAYNVLYEINELYDVLRTKHSTFYMLHPIYSLALHYTTMGFQGHSVALEMFRKDLTVDGHFRNKTTFSSHRDIDFCYFFSSFFSGCIKYSLTDLEQTKKFNKQNHIITLLVIWKDYIKEKMMNRTHSCSSCFLFLPIKGWSLSSNGEHVGQPMGSSAVGSITFADHHMSRLTYTFHLPSVHMATAT